MRAGNIEFGNPRRSEADDRIELKCRQVFEKSANFKRALNCDSGFACAAMISAAHRVQAAHQIYFVNPAESQVESPVERIGTTTSFCKACHITPIAIVIDAPRSKRERFLQGEISATIEPRTTRQLCNDDSDRSCLLTPGQQPIGAGNFRGKMLVTHG
jgi:hypothetical protein